MARLQTVAWVCFAPKYQAPGESVISISVSWRSWYIGTSSSNTFERLSLNRVTVQESLLTVNRSQMQNIHPVLNFHHACSIETILWHRREIIRLGDGANLFQADKSPECRLKAKLFFQVYIVSIPLLGKPFAGILDIRDLNLPKESPESNHRAWDWKRHPSLKGSFRLMRSEFGLGGCFRKRVQGAGGLHHRSEGTGNCHPDLLGGVFDVLETAVMA
jgi:hypothetical protein